MATKIKLLFVCMGNICRSPSAEAIMRSMIQSKSLEKFIHLDSCGTHGYHAGDLPDERMRAHAEKRDYILDMPARKFYADKDFKEFDYILTMDNNNYEAIKELASSNDEEDKIIPICNYCKTHAVSEVPDPYYGGSQGFENVLNILEDACSNLLKQIRAKHQF